MEPLFVFLTIVLLLTVPFIAVWAVNVVFGTTLAITGLKMWFAVLVLLALIGGR